MADELLQHPACLSDDALLAECRVERLRRSGPGGQHRNKVETAVRLTHQPTGLSVEASERRSQSQNLARALRRLRLELAIGQRRRVGVTPTTAWQARCRLGRVVISEEHADFPGLLAEALDTLAAEDWDVAGAAGRLGCSATQLVKLLSRDSRALQELNRQRAEHGLRPLRPS